MKSDCHLIKYFYFWDFNVFLARLMWSSGFGFRSGGPGLDFQVDHKLWNNVWIKLRWSEGKFGKASQAVQV